MTKTYYVYILTNRSGNLYTGVTNDLHRRVYEHKQGTGRFTSRYKIDRLIYFEETNDVSVALTREKEIKDWRREKRVALIASMNPKWRDLSEGWFQDDRQSTANAQSAAPALHD